MISNNLLNISNRLRSEADFVIRRSKIHDFFNNLGDIKFVGGYELNLLFRRDIDLFVINNDVSKELAIHTTKDLLDSKLFQTVGLANTVDYPFPNLPYGYYWELVLYENESRWKFDIWYTNENNVDIFKKTKKIAHKLAEKPEAR